MSVNKKAKTLLICITVCVYTVMLGMVLSGCSPFFENLQISEEDPAHKTEGETLVAYEEPETIPENNITKTGKTDLEKAGYQEAEPYTLSETFEEDFFGDDSFLDTPHA